MLFAAVAPSFLNLISFVSLIIENKEYFSFGLLVEISHLNTWFQAFGLHYFFFHFKDQTMNRGATIISRLIDD